MSCEASPEIPEAPETFGVPSLPLYKLKVLASTDPEVISEESIPFQKAEFFGYKAFAANLPVNNAATIWVGFRNTNFVRSITAGASKVIEAPRGQKFNLATMYIKGTNPDGVVVEYS